VRPPPPTLEVDDELVLTGWRLADAAAHRRFAEDEDAARFFGWTVDEARAQPETHYVAVVRRFQDEWRAGPRLSLAIRRRDTGQAVGAVELRPDAGKVDVSYLVDPKFRGQGIAPRALATMLDWAARELSATSALLSCDVDNVASRRVAAKCGFEQIGQDKDELRFARSLT
jgi:RimJ/RimL family protein N-acetyltransferase